MDPAQALADLTEISSALEAAVLAAPDGAVVASTIEDAGRAEGIAENAVGLFDGARRVVDGARELTQVQVATREGCVFVVRDERHVLAAVTGPAPTAGLVFYDLKATLRQIDAQPGKTSRSRAKADEKATPKPKPRRRTAKKEQPAGEPSDA